MKIDRLACKGFSTAFPGIVELSLRELPPGLIAVVGPNGHGKTSILELAPGTIYRQLPGRGDRDPVTYATDRDSWTEVDFTLEGYGAMRARLHLDGPKRQTDAVLLENGQPLTDGKRSTYDAAIAELFPSFGLFINSAFAAQGRGDEFSRRKPAERKVLFAEFLALEHYAARAAVAKDAGDLVDDARLRLEVAVEQLEQQAAPAVVDALDRLANELQARGGAAELEQRAAREQIDDLEGRIALRQDPAAELAAATLRLKRIDGDLVTRRGELSRLAQARGDATVETISARERLTRERDRALTDIRNRIAGNERLKEQAEAIRAAAAALPIAREALAAAQAEQDRARASRDETTRDLSAAVEAVSAFTRPQQELERARTDSALLTTVPCGGTGAYAACQFLLNATAAAARIASLEQLLRGLTAAVQHRETCERAVQVREEALVAIAHQIRQHQATVALHEPLAKYAAPLAEGEARVAELRERETETAQAAERSLADLEAQLARTQAQLDEQAGGVVAAIAALESEREAAQADVDAATAGHQEAASLREQLAGARGRGERAIAAIAAVRAGEEDLARRRESVALAREDLADRRARLARVQAELVEWRDLEAALKKLPDIEIDAAGPSISARTNELLTHCYGPRFSLELVTQVEKADGSGLKDLFTVRVFDNEKGGGWRDIQELSGGQKVVIQEALMCAIALYVNERLPVPIRTLWRDETGAALDVEHAPRYVEMLRKVRELGGFHHVYFVSHNPAAAALADVQIQVQDGQARIALPPFDISEAA